METDTVSQAATETAKPSSFRPAWTDKQTGAFALLRDYPRLLLYDGSRSGKTRVLVEFDTMACLKFPGLRILFVRYRRQHAKESIWHETLLGEVLKRYKKVLVPEMNTGQLAFLLRARYLLDVESYSKVQGKPFKVAEIRARAEEILAGGKSS